MEAAREGTRGIYRHTEMGQLPELHNCWEETQGAGGELPWPQELSWTLLGQDSSSFDFNLTLPLLFSKCFCTSHLSAYRTCFEAFARAGLSIWKAFPWCLPMDILFILQNLDYISPLHRSHRNLWVGPSLSLCVCSRLCTHFSGPASSLSAQSFFVSGP